MPTIFIWSDSRIQRALQWLITNHLFEPGDLIELSQLQPYRLLSDRAIILYKLVFITLTSLILGSLFGLLYGPGLILMVISLMVTPVPEVVQPWDAVWSIFIPLVKGWLKASWLVSFFMSWFGLFLGSKFGAFNHISTSGRLWLNGNRVLKLVTIIVGLGIIASLTILKPYSAFGTVMALIPNLILFTGLQQLPKRKVNSKSMAGQYWWMLILTNSFFLGLLFAYVLGMIRWSMVRFDTSLLPWPFHLDLPWINYWIQAIPWLSFGSLVGLVFLLKSPLVSQSIALLQSWSLRLVLAINRKWPLHQRKLLDRAAELGFLEKQDDKYMIINFGAIMAEVS